MATNLEQALAIMMIAHQPKLVNRLQVERHPRASYTFHAHRSNPALVIVKTSLSLNEPKELEMVREMAHAAYECLEGRTSAVRLGRGMGL